MMSEAASTLLALLVGDLRAEGAVCVRKGEVLARVGAEQGHRCSTEMLVERSLDMRAQSAKDAGDAVVLDGRERGLAWQALGIEIGDGIALVVTFDVEMDANAVAAGVLAVLPVLRGLFDVPGAGGPGPVGSPSGGQGSSGAPSHVGLNEPSPRSIRESN